MNKNNLNKLPLKTRILMHVDDLMLFLQKPQIKKLKKSSEGEWRKIVTLQYKTLALRYPAIFHAVLDDGEHFNRKKLVSMLDVLNRVNAGTANLEEETKKIYEEQRKKYVDPIIEQQNKEKQKNQQNQENTEED